MAVHVGVRRLRQPPLLGRPPRLARGRLHDERRELALGAALLLAVSVLDYACLSCTLLALTTLTCSSSAPTRTIETIQRILRAGRRLGPRRTVRLRPGVDGVLQADERGGHRGVQAAAQGGPGRGGAVLQLHALHERGDAAGHLGQVGVDVELRTAKQLAR